MTDKFRKINKEYVLSDSSVNEYGFRLLTEGYQADSFLKNPIGYYMHRREDGVALKWEDLHIAGDTVLATPVVNLSNTRGAQIYDEFSITPSSFYNCATYINETGDRYSTIVSILLSALNKYFEAKELTL